ncbi:hypothetical protein FYK55_00855 [Roseiconus nitratireducens]|uniref:Uncharacterized protein n=1 Tax=Roseiconus nitratireducens TaxID=2605748 RepID=A0A5M6DLA6_9BACT|nr:hypothetical protein [Roseiconus nitratireducens]KAA5546999.1 hypothetical protein FYK55_00855 [Roseiconus nitratireducens]
MTKLEFEAMSVVAVGSFNIYIFEPKWLVKQNVVSKEPDRFELALSRPGFRVTAGDLILTIEPHRVEIRCEDAGRDCVPAMKQILLSLPETPMTALGANRHYSGRLESDDDLPVFNKSVPDSLFGACLPTSRALTLKFPPSARVVQEFSLEQDKRVVKATANAETLDSDASELAERIDSLPKALDSLATTVCDPLNLELSPSPLKVAP